jgi:hypothetical protein
MANIYRQTPYGQFDEAEAVAVLDNLTGESAEYVNALVEQFIEHAKQKYPKVHFGKEQAKAVIAKVIAAGSFVPKPLQ